MILEPEFRLALIYLLVLKTGIGIWRIGASLRRESSSSSALGLSLFAGLASFLYVTPLLVLIIVPFAVQYGQFYVDPSLRWLASFPIAAALILLVWSIPSKNAAQGYRAATLRRVRYPEEAGNALFYLCISVLAANWLVVVSWALATVVQLLVIVAREEAARRAREKAGDEADMGLLSMLGPVADRQYTVPRRFGMAAIVALLTTFGILFGVLKYINAPPVIYLFAASEISAICLVQIIYGAAPRGGSILIGAMLLPFWVAVTVQAGPGWLPREVIVLGYVSLVAFGGLMGYCIGALAAGFFLMMDLIEPLLPGADAETLIETPGRTPLPGTPHAGKGS